MLTKIRRQLARDGLVMWRVHAMVPPRVDYSLTPIGEQLGESVCGVWLWVEAHMEEMRRARRSTTRLGSDQRRQLVGPAQKLIAGLLANAEDAEISNSPAVSFAVHTKLAGMTRIVLERGATPTGLRTPRTRLR
jgi:HxlR-like helix-turn-helix